MNYQLNSRIDGPYRAYFFQRQNGRCPFEDYLHTINSLKELAYLQAMIDKLISNHGQLPYPYAKKVEGKIWELRTKFGHRAFYFIAVGRDIIIIDGYTKKRDRIETRVRERIRKMYQEYLITKLRKPYLTDQIS